MTTDMKIKLSMFLKMQIRLNRFYLQLASFAKNQHLNNFATYLKQLSDDKITKHKDLIFNYLNDQNIALDLENTPCGLKDTVRAKLLEIKTIDDVFELINYAEGEETKRRIDEILVLAMHDQDYLTFNFMQWFVSDYLKDYFKQWKIIYDAYLLQKKHDVNNIDYLSIEAVIHCINQQFINKNK